jgi:hypothetical protein
MLSRKIFSFLIFLEEAQRGQAATKQVFIQAAFFQK